MAFVGEAFAILGAAVFALGLGLSLEGGGAFFAGFESATASFGAFERTSAFDGAALVGLGFFVGGFAPASSDCSFRFFERGGLAGEDLSASSSSADSEESAAETLASLRALTFAFMAFCFSRLALMASNFAFYNISVSSCFSERSTNAHTFFSARLDDAGPSAGFGVSASASAARTRRRTSVSASTAMAASLTRVNRRVCACVINKS